MPKVHHTEGEHSALLKLKEFKPGALCRPSEDAFDLIRKTEQLFRKKTNASLMDHENAVNLLQTEANVLASGLPVCHDIKTKVTNRYIRLRLRIAARHIRAERKKPSGGSHLGSKKPNKGVKKDKPGRATSRPTTSSRPTSNTWMVQ